MKGKGTKGPLCICGVTKDNGFVFGGAFQMADTYGFPLSFSIDKAKSMGCAVSIPHYFASAIEHGWDDRKTFSHIKEAFEDCGLSKDFDAVKKACIATFMAVANQMPNCDAMDVARRMRVALEQDKFASEVNRIWEKYQENRT